MKGFFKNTESGLVQVAINYFFSYIVIACKRSLSILKIQKALIEHERFSYPRTPLQAHVW
jgi:hypothetical protein